MECSRNEYPSPDNDLLSHPIGFFIPFYPAVTFCEVAGGPGPLGAIRDNEQRSTALGFKAFPHQIYSLVFGSSISSIGGILFALWLRYVDPESVLGVFSMVDYLLMVIIGGLGTMYGSIIGAAFFIIVQTWLPDLLRGIAANFPGYEIIQRMAERWMAYFGVMFVVVILVFPKGIVGTVQKIIRRRRMASFK